MAAEGPNHLSDAGVPHRRTRPPERARLDFRCHGCGLDFAGDAGGPGVCPRCGAIGGHTRSIDR